MTTPHSNHTPIGERTQVLMLDMNGVLRGKWLPAAKFSSLTAGEVRLPLSTSSLDIWGEENDDITGLSISCGDPDGMLRPDMQTHVPVPWSDTQAGQVLATLVERDGTPSFADPRAILQRAVDAYAERGWQACVAVELEFYLYVPPTEAGGLATPLPAYLGTDGSLIGQLYEAEALESFSGFIDTIKAFSATQRIPTETVIAELGPGQFEINLIHCKNALLAADHAVMFRRLVREAARRHGYEATFMAKPFTDAPGSGLHIHLSVFDEAQQNIFSLPSADGGQSGSQPNDALRHACAGVVRSLRDTQAIYAPSANAYRRFQPNSHAPILANWGLEHRGAAVRLPETRGPGARLEHRVGGADANPHLVTAGLLWAALEGMEKKSDAGPPLETSAPQGEVAFDDPSALTHDWLTAIERFAASEFVTAAYGERFRTLFGDVKRHEARAFQRRVTAFDHETYLRRF